MDEKNPHAVCIPFPAQGHINPTLKVAKLLHHKAVEEAGEPHDTTSDVAPRRSTRVSRQKTHHLRDYEELPCKKISRFNSLPDFQFETIPNGLPSSDTDTTQDIPALSQSTSSTCLVPFRNLLSKVNTAEDIPPITCIVSDGVMSFTLQAAEEIGFPEVLFWTNSACSLLAYMHFLHLIERGFTPLKDVSYLSNGYLDTPLDWIP
ncbi:hypothetical protein NE237_016722 [Protea cynaroides]|uniref:Uncharacterized protein n=1 Tax=Protea cynaroides TaxID=273540 RepID=A0A9Q0HEP8_9MAGN|nr:hypothetical protein NE237_016722 [Protea cynaroides]